MGKVFQSMLNLFYPAKCPFCGKILDVKVISVCEDCVSSLPYTSIPDGRRGLVNIEECISPLYYRGTVRDALHRYKFGGVSAYSDLFGKMIYDAVKDSGIVFDIISWVPLSRRRLRSRGYDQAFLLAEKVSEISGVKIEKTLKKVRNVRAQSSTGNRNARRDNIRDAYIPLNIESVRGKAILLVDDIVTTGATLEECARVLKSAECGTIYAATLARTE